MRVVIQRVKDARVIVSGNIVGEINQGLLVLCGFEETDDQTDIDWITHKLIHLRIFNDEGGQMNLSVQDVDGDFLIVSQFTLHASTKKGNRPSYIKAAKPAISIPLYEQFLRTLKSSYGKEIQSGEFGADMDVQLTNDGPVTIIMDSKQKDI